MRINVRINEGNRDRGGLAEIRLERNGEPTYKVDLPFEVLFERFGVPDELSLDLLITATICYIADKIIPRANVNSEDSWTRDIEIEIPVADEALWLAARTGFSNTLNFLTGDRWILNFRHRHEQLFAMPRPIVRRIRREFLPNVTTVCSLSGGVDSLVGAIDLLEANENERIQFIGHYDGPGTKKPQSALFDRLKQTYPGRTELLQVRARNKPLESKESTLRSRSFVFFAIGLYAARNVGNNASLYMPENGFIALNVPLTPSRMGSCSTRTMHPIYLARLRVALDALGIENQIINPLEMKTKGECISDCANFALLQNMIDLTVSCSHSTRRQNWVRRTAEYKNCGYCIPCIVRRAALNQSNLDNPARYGLDICNGEIDYRSDKGTSDDFRAAISAIQTNRTQDDFERALVAVAMLDNLQERAGVVYRGMAEIKALLETKCTVEVLRNIGLAN